jgi:RNA polymerase sigma factor (sigma-70 family)
MVKLDPKLMKMAISIARGFIKRLPKNVMSADLEQAAMIGLLDGLRRHPHGAGAGWEWYLRRRISGEVIDELRRQDWSKRRRSGRPVPKMVHLEDLPSRDGWEDHMPGDYDSPEDSAIMRLDAAKAWATPLGARDARIMHASFGSGRKHMTIAADEGVSEARVSQRVTRSLSGMRCHLTGEVAPLTVPRATAQALWKRQIER